MILEILKYPNPDLAKQCEPVSEIDGDIRELAKNMLETMYAADGVGLAAPQIGRHLRMLVMDPGWRDGPKAPRVIINPELKLLGDMIISEGEGCLSVPLGFRADVPRASHVHLSGMDLDGNQLDELLDGMDAIVVQHETDHLDGHLFIDRISRLKRNIYDGKVKKWQKAQE